MGMFDHWNEPFHPMGDDESIRAHFEKVPVEKEPPADIYPATDIPDPPTTKEEYAELVGREPWEIGEYTYGSSKPRFYVKPGNIRPRDEVCLWEILVPASSKKQPFSYDHHKRWDEYVRSLAGGLTVLRTGKGEWVCPAGEIYHDALRSKSCYGIQDS